MVYKLVLIRHGESTWNQENRFTGWTDVPLNSTGESEAVLAGKILKEHNYSFDVSYTSVLKRAIHTCWTVLKEIDQCHIPVIKTWRLNERHYGALQGLNKSETASQHGEDQVKLWRRAYDIPPPPLDPKDKRYSINEPMYKKLPVDILPLTECLKDTVDRVLPFWFDTAAPAILNNHQVLIVAHGNSLRALVKHLRNMSEEEIINLNIPTGVPLIFELDHLLKPMKHYYLMDEAELNAKIAAVANQGKVK